MEDSSIRAIWKGKHYQTLRKKEIAQQNYCTMASMILLLNLLALVSSTQPAKALNETINYQNGLDISVTVPLGTKSANSFLSNSPQVNNRHGCSL